MWRSPGELVREHLRLSVDFRVGRHQHVQLSTGSEALVREIVTTVPRQQRQNAALTPYALLAMAVLMSFSAYLFGTRRFATVEID